MISGHPSIEYVHLAKQTFQGRPCCKFQIALGFPFQVLLDRVWTGGVGAVNSCQDATWEEYSVNPVKLRVGQDPVCPFPKVNGSSSPSSMASNQPVRWYGCTLIQPYIRYFTTYGTSISPRTSQNQKKIAFTQSPIFPQ